MSSFVWRGIGLVSTIIIMLLLIVMLIQVTEINKRLSKVENQISVLIPLIEEASKQGDNPIANKKAIYTLNAIERFIRTTPLVECGNCDGRRKETTIHGDNK